MMTHEQFYKACNLTENPFRSNPAADADPRQGVWVGYPKEREVLTKFLERSLSDRVGNANFVLLYGDFGVGKSHALLWSQYQVLHAAKDVYQSAAYYITTLMREKGKLSFAGAFREDVVDKSSMISDILRYKQFVHECMVEYKRENHLDSDVSWDKVAERMVPSMDMLNVLRLLIKCEVEADVRQFLAVDGDYEAILLFCHLTNLFVYGYRLQSGQRQFKKAVYLFIDELDLLANASAKEAREVNNHLRHIYDFCPNCFFLGLGFTASSAEIGVLFADYVLSRVSKQIVLEYLQPDEAKEFVKEILNTARVDAKKKKDYYPFAEDAIAAIMAQIVSITPRKVVNTMQQVIEECRLAGLDPSKSPIATTDLDKHSIWEMIG